jgi:hypothetical protein
MQPMPYAERFIDFWKGHIESSDISSHNIQEEKNI